MQENFGGRVKLIPLHGSLHEVLCERKDDCCLVQVQRENGCDSVYFRCDHSDTDSRDAIDGDTVVYKRSISLVEERIQKVRKPKTRPKSEVYEKNTNKHVTSLSNSSPSLNVEAEVEVNLENAICYQDSSSDECLKCHADCDEFERIEKKIEEDVAKDNSHAFYGCLEKISEENLSLIGDDLNEKDRCSVEDSQIIYN